MADQPRHRRRRLVAAGAVLVLVLGALGALAVTSLLREPGDVENPDVEFTTPATTTATIAAPSPKRNRDAVFTWPQYGWDKARTKAFALPDPQSLHPPYSQRWAFRGSILLEFPPILARRSLYLLKNNGALYCLSRRTGKVLWKRKLGYLAASSPAYADGTIYVTILLRGKGTKGGRVVAVDARTGRTKWSKRLAARSESSPLVDRGSIFFGAEDGSVFKLRASDGFTRWRYKADGAVKAGLALSGDTLYVGDYGGKVHAIKRVDGSQRWEASGADRGIGRTGGRFYSTPAVNYDRVYLGSTDGFVYAFGAATGRLAWRRKTGGFVYSGPAVTQVPGGKPTVYVGSYDRKLYALDARTGRPRWIRQAGGRISGGVQVIGDLVWASTLEKTTTAYGARTGRTVWQTKRGQYNPAVTDGRRIYFVGYSSLFALTPERFLLQGAKGRCLQTRRGRCVRRAKRARKATSRAAKRERVRQRRGGSRRSP